MAYQSGESSALAARSRLLQADLHVERTAHRPARASGQARRDRALARRHPGSRRARARIRQLGGVRQERDRSRRPREAMEPAAVPHRGEAPHDACATLAREEGVGRNPLRDGGSEDLESRRWRSDDRCRSRAARRSESHHAAQLRRNEADDRRRPRASRTPAATGGTRSERLPRRADHRPRARSAAPSARAQAIPDVLAARDLGRRRGQPQILRASGKRGSPGHAHGRRRHRCRRRKAQAATAQDRTRRHGFGAAAASSDPRLQDLARRRCRVFADERRRRTESPAARRPVHQQGTRQPRGARRALRAQLLLAHLRPDGRRPLRARGSSQPGFPRM